MIATVTKIMSAGFNYVEDPAFSAATILRVKRSGIGFNETLVAPSDREYKHNSMTGVISFRDKVDGSEATDVENEDIRVTYKY